MHVRGTYGPGYCPRPDRICAAVEVDGGADWGVEELGGGEGAIGHIFYLRNIL